jgi:hypothetical protein
MPTLTHAGMTERIVRSGSGILRKFAQFRVARGNKAAEHASAWLNKRKEIRKTLHYLDTGIRPERYRESVRRKGQEDLDTNRGAAGQKTWRGGRPTQGKGRRGYNHRA